MLLAIIKRELKIAFRNSTEIVNPLLFFVIVITLFPLSIGPEPKLLERIAPGIIWVAALLSSLLSLERLFKDDYLDGSLEQLMLLPVPLPLIVCAKVISHWLLPGLPLLIFSPLILVDHGHHVAAGDANFEFYWRHWGGVNRGVTQGRGTAEFADFAAVYPRVDFCHRYAGCVNYGHATERLFGHFRRHAHGQHHLIAVCRCRRAAH